MDDTAKKLIDEVLTPLFAVDGGTIELVGLTDHRLLIRFGGVYKGCPSRSFTLSGIVEPLVRRWLGPDVRVEAVD